MGTRHSEMEYTCPGSILTNAPYKNQCTTWITEIRKYLRTLLHTGTVGQVREALAIVDFVLDI